MKSLFNWILTGLTVLTTSCATPEPQGIDLNGLSIKSEIFDSVTKYKVTSNNSFGIEFEPVASDALHITTLPDNTTRSSKLHLTKGDFEKERRKGNRHRYRMEKASNGQVVLTYDALILQGGNGKPCNIQATIRNPVEFSSGTFEDLRNGGAAEFNVLDTKESFEAGRKYIQDIFNTISETRGEVVNVEEDAAFGVSKGGEITVSQRRSSRSIRFTSGR